MYVYICIYILDTDVYIYVDMYVCRNTHTCMHMLCISMRVVNVSVYVSVYVRVYVYIVCVCTVIYIHTDIHPDTHIPFNSYEVVLRGIYCRLHAVLGLPALNVL